MTIYSTFRKGQRGALRITFSCSFSRLHSSTVFKKPAEKYLSSIPMRDKYAYKSSALLRSTLDLVRKNMCEQRRSLSSATIECSAFLDVRIVSVLVPKWRLISHSRLPKPLLLSGKSKWIIVLALFIAKRDNASFQ